MQDVVETFDEGMYAFVLDSLPAWQETLRGRSVDRGGRTAEGHKPDTISTI